MYICIYVYIYILFVWQIITVCGTHICPFGDLVSQLATTKTVNSLEHKYLSVSLGTENSTNTLSEYLKNEDKNQMRICSRKYSSTPADALAVSHFHSLVRRYGAVDPYRKINGPAQKHPLNSLKEILPQLLQDQSCANENLQIPS